MAVNETTNSDVSNCFPNAIYSRQAIREQQGNKFIEALPALKDEEDLVAGMLKRADVLPADRAESTFVRQHMIASIPSSFLQPLTDHVLLATEVSKIVRAGYLNMAWRSSGRVGSARRQPSTPFWRGILR